MPELGNWPHLMLDCYRCDAKKLDDMQFVYRFLEELPGKLNMHALCKPYAMRNDTGSDYGITGFVVIAESHISIHTFPKQEYFTMDVYSCKPFDAEKITPYITEAFDSREYDKHVIMRGRSSIPTEEI
jgi:S-adenosylmethionine decarboxylase